MTAKTTRVGAPQHDNESDAPIVGTKPDGQLTSYEVLTEDERAKGFVRPVRTKYLHTKCGTVTQMSRAIAETFARDPSFYTHGFCVACRDHLPNEEFLWDGTDERVGS